MVDTETYERILVPTDGSEAAETAIGHACSIATRYDAVIEALYVIDGRVTMAATDDTRERLTDSLTADGEAAVERVATAATEADVPVETHIAHGTPAKEILDHAEADGIDLIVMGSAGKSPREKLIGMGSVSEGVVDEAPLPVLVIPDR